MKEALTVFISDSIRPATASSLMYQFVPIRNKKLISKEYIYGNNKSALVYERLVCTPFRLLRK